MLSVDRLKQAELQVNRAPWWGERQGIVRKKDTELWLQAGARVRGSRQELCVTLSSMTPHPNQDLFPACMAFFLSISLPPAQPVPSLSRIPPVYLVPTSCLMASVLTEVLELGPAWIRDTKPRTCRLSVLDCPREIVLNAGLSSTLPTRQARQLRLQILCD